MSNILQVKYTRGTSKYQLEGDLGTLRYTMGEYLKWLSLRFYSVCTVDNQKKALYYFALYCEDLGIEAPGEISLFLLERYRKHLSVRKSSSGQSLSIGTQKGYLGSVKNFTSWLYKQQYINHPIALDLDMPRSIKSLPRDVMSESDVERVVSCVDISKSVGLRDRAMMELFYSCGIRRSELVFLKTKDVRLQERILFIEDGKGGKDRYIPFGERAVYWLGRYLREVRPKLAQAKDVGYLFLTVHGDYLSSSHLFSMMSDYVKASGLGKRGACHIFRRTMATLMLDGGADIRHVQSMLGHTNIVSTQIYTHVSMHKLKEVHEKAHPGFKLNPAIKK